MNQATVVRWEPEVGGAAFLDDGSVIELPADALQGSAFRFVRAGQRIQVVSTDPVRVDLPRS